MKNKILFLICFLFAGFNLKAQTKVVQHSDTLVEVVAQVTVESLTDGCILLPQVFKNASGEVFQVWQSKEEKLFIVRQSKKTGRFYRQYLTTSL